MQGSIVISGQPGAGSTTIAKHLTSKLGWNHFSMGQVFKDIAEGTAQNKYYFSMLDSMLKEKSIKLPILKSRSKSQALLDLWNTEVGKSKAFHETLDSLQRELARTNLIVIDGKLSIKMVPEAKIKIWICAPFNVRAQRLAERHNISLGDSIKSLEAREKRERHEWKSIYGFDYFDQYKEADIVIDTEKVSQEQATKIIIEKLNSI